MQDKVLSCLGGIWFNRSESKDRIAVAKKYLLTFKIETLVSLWNISIKFLLFNNIHFLTIFFCRITEHIKNPNNNPLLIFPEGVCVNNEYCVMFKKGVCFFVLWYFFCFVFLSDRCEYLVFVGVRTRCNDLSCCYQIQVHLSIGNCSQIEILQFRKTKQNKIFIECCFFVK